MTHSGPIHVILITHTTRHLRRTLLGVASQTRPPDSVVVSCDVDDDEIRQHVAEVNDELGLTLTLVRRRHHGKSRSAQVRNNGVRALLDQGDASNALLVFFDGDCCPGPDVLQVYGRLRGAGDLIVGHRIDLTPEQTEAFDEAALAAGRPPVTPSAVQLRALAQRHRRYIRSALLRRIGLAKAHKPKVLSANFGVTLARFRDVNGFDEEYEGWGGEDDDLGRRIYRAGGRPVVGVRDLLVYHLYHETRGTTCLRDNPGVKRFQAGGPVSCQYGLDLPYPQDPVQIIAWGSR